MLRKPEDMKEWKREEIGKVEKPVEEVAEAVVEVIEANEVKKEEPQKPRTVKRPPAKRKPKRTN